MVVLLADLGGKQRVTHTFLYRTRELSQVLTRRRDPSDALHHVFIIPILVFKQTEILV